MKFSNIMIVTDLDGTFYDSKSKLVPKNLEAIEYFKKNGGLFTIATGRIPSTFLGAGEIYRSLANAPAILCNGAFCCDFAENKRFLQIDVDHKKASEIVRFVKENFDITRIRACAGGYENTVTDLSILDGLTDWTRVSFDDESTETLTKIRDALEDNYKNDFAFMFACSKILEFQAKSATKGQALVRLRKKLISDKIADENLTVYAVGDYENDLDLLNSADVACCPENAIDKIKAVSKVHLCHCDDGTTADLISRIDAGEV